MYLVESVDIADGDQKGETRAYGGYCVGGILLVAEAIESMLKKGILVNSSSGVQ